MKKSKKIVLVALMFLFMPVSLMLTGCFSVDYRVYIKNGLKNITITASASQAEEGEVIKLSYSNLNPDYVFNYYTVNNKKIEGNSFKMPQNNVEVSASLTKVRYTINYVLKTNETTFSQTKFKEDDGIITLIDADKPEYVFMGWYESPYFTGEKITQIDASTKKDYVLYPKFISVKVDQDGFRLINSPEDFIEIAEQNSTGKLRLNNDLNFANYSFTGIQSAFKGEFDGNNKVIKNISLTGGEETLYAGLFNRIDGAKVYHTKCRKPDKDKYHMI